MPYPAKIDLHMHTTASDGTDAPEDILARVREAGITVFSVTDHDAVKACRIVLDRRRPDDPEFITGAEFSCRDELGQYHVLGYGYDPEAPSILALVNKSHARRMEKFRARVAFLETEFGFRFPREEIEKLETLNNPGKPHLGNLMVRFGYAESKEKAIRDYINKLRFRTGYNHPKDAIAAILGAGGIPVLAHPSYGSGEQLVLGEEMEARLRRLIDFGLQGVEAFYSGFSPKLQREMLAFAEQFGLYVTAGSDYHGTNKLVPLGDTNLDIADAWPEGLCRFLDEVPKRT